MRVLVFGAGGIGGYFGGRLLQAGVDVSFFVRSARAARLRGEGLVIESPIGNARLPVVAIEQGDGAYDLVLLSCKAYDLGAAIAALGPAIGPDTTLVPLLNGLAHLDALDAAFGADRVLGGLAHISVELAADGTVRHLNSLQTITLGARDATQGARADAAVALLRQGSFEVKHSDVVLQDMWEKFSFITAAAGITCLMRAPVGAVMAAQGGEALTLQMIAECDAIAAASGHAVRAKAERWAKSFLTKLGSDFTASMLRDLEAGNRIEADHLQGDMIRRGAALGVSTPLLAVAFCHLQAYENRRCGRS